MIFMYLINMGLKKKHYVSNSNQVRISSSSEFILNEWHLKHFRHLSKTLVTPLSRTLFVKIYDSVSGYIWQYYNVASIYPHIAGTIATTSVGCVSLSVNQRPTSLFLQSWRSIPFQRILVTLYDYIIGDSKTMRYSS